MFKDVQITLYDIFGYLLPGAVLLLAIISLFWTLFWASAPLVLPARLPSLAITTLLFAAYLLGHLGQGLGNLLEKLPQVRKRLDQALPMSPELEKLVRGAVASRFGKVTESLKPRELFTLCDQALLHNGSAGEREIFVYREGFYRGNTVALGLLCLSIFLRLVGSPATVILTGEAVEVYRAQMALAGVLTGFGTWLAYRRYVRFGEHMYRTCFLRFLSLRSPSESKKNGQA